MKSFTRTASLAVAATLAAAAVGATAYAHSDGPRGGAGYERGQHAQGQHAGKGEHRHAHGQRGDQHSMGDRQNMRRMAGGMMDRLGLSQEQRDRLFELRHGAQPEMRAAMLEARAQREALRELGRADTFDATAAQDVSRALADAQAQALLLRTQLHADMAAVLTPEQREQMGQWFEARAEGRGRGGRGMMP